ncbi:MAG TPA: hypothetical protein GX716_00755 [Firmicutes bacterium]|nr:hypothetical protein [Candidatus Fermentithermobacillaceae bacterium]
MTRPWPQRLDQVWTGSQGLVIAMHVGVSLYLSIITGHSGIPSLHMQSHSASERLWMHISQSILSAPTPKRRLRLLGMKMKRLGGIRNMNGKKKKKGGNPN